MSCGERVHRVRGCWFGDVWEPLRKPIAALEPANSVQALPASHASGNFIHSFGGPRDQRLCRVMQTEPKS